MDAVQRDRQKARDYGYLRSNTQMVVSGGPYIAITPVNPAFVCVPVYDPRVVYFAPRPGFFIGGAIGFGYGVTIGTWFRPWGWGYNRFDWREHGVFINNRPWGREWVNRAAYVHPYVSVQRWEGPRHEERHELIARSEHERQQAREGHERGEEREHGRGDDRHRPH